MKKLPHHGHNPEDLGGYGETLPIQVIPQIDWQRMAADAWNGFITQLGAWTVENISAVIESWSNVISALGEWTTEIITDVLESWNNLVTALGGWTTDILASVIGSWGNMITALGEWTSEIVTNIFNTWETIVEGLGPWTAGIINDVIETWNKLIDAAGLGPLWAEIVKIGTGVYQWLSDFFTGYGGSNPQVDFNKLSAIPYKLPTSAYNYILNPSYEYGAWGGSDTQSEDYSKFGKYSGKLVAVGSDIDGGWSNYIDVRGLTELTINVWMKVTSRTAGLFQSWIEYYNSTKVYITDSMIKIGELNAVTDWTQKTLTDSDLPSGACFARVRNVWRDTPTGTGYCDGWQLNIGDQTPAFQDFTNYSWNWMPSQIDTEETSSYAWSSTDPTEILTLTFECESKMLCIILAFTRLVAMRAAAGDDRGQIWLRIDEGDATKTYGKFGTSSSIEIHDTYHVHKIEILAKGSHTIDIVFKALSADTTVYAYDRRITVIKGFYQGGTT